jgi:hypothetical protein
VHCDTASAVLLLEQAGNNLACFTVLASGMIQKKQEQEVSLRALGMSITVTAQRHRALACVVARRSFSVLYLPVVRCRRLRVRKHVDSQSTLPNSHSVKSRSTIDMTPHCLRAVNCFWNWPCDEGLVNGVNFVHVQHEQTTRQHDLPERLNSS